MIYCSHYNLYSITNVDFPFDKIKIDVDLWFHNIGHLITPFAWYFYSAKWVLFIFSEYNDFYFKYKFYLFAISLHLRPLLCNNHAATFVHNIQGIFSRTLAHSLLPRFLKASRNHTDYEVTISIFRCERLLETFNDF